MNLGKLAQVLGGATTAGGAVAAGTAGVLDQNKEEEWVGRLRDFLHPPAAPPMGSIASQEVAHRFAPQGSEISQGDAFWMGGGRSLPQRSAEDAYRMAGLARTDQYKPNTFRDIDRADIEDRYGGTDIHGIKLPPVSKDEPRAWFDAVVPQSPLDVGLMAAGPAGRLAGKGAAALTGAAGVMGELVDPAEAGGMGKLLRGKPGGPWEGGIRAYHSSPHDFDRFDWSKLRTGEGANTFGAGFYAAENPAVSGQGGQYWNQFLGRMPKEEMRSAEWLKQHGFDRDAAVDALRAELDRTNEVLARGAHPIESQITAIRQKHADTLRQRLDAFTSGAPVGPRTYEVNINARPELLLDWDKPVKDQPHVVDMFRQLGYRDASWPYSGKLTPGGEGNFVELGGSGGDAYRVLGKPPYATDAAVPDFNRASDMLREAGIPGIRYLDRGSRPNSGFELQSLQGALQKAEAAGNAAEAAALRGEIHSLQNPTYNYVVTDPSKLDILGKYGVVGTAGGGMAALAAQDQYQR